jgi:peptidoglycan/LPS O-acetylase OafA/YrhL
MATDAIRSEAGEDAVAQRQVSQKEHGVYYPAFDGLRAIAASAVFLWHYGDLPYGWAGVDLFFVLSGFLITGILFDSVNAEHRYRTFYIRRSLRIFPAYYAVLAALVFFAIARRNTPPWGFVLWPFYIGNYALVLLPHQQLQTIGSLEIGHFWTLCVEEQFYLLWPAVVYTVRKRQTLIAICFAVICLVPLLRSFLLFGPEPWAMSADVILRGTPTRCDSLLLGAAVALVMRGPKRGWLLKAARPIAIVSGCLLLIAMLVAHYYFGNRTSDAQQPWVTSLGLTVIGVFSLGLVLMSIDVNSPIARVLMLPPLRRFGRITYGFYIFHAIPMTLFMHLRERLTGHGVSESASKYLVLVVAFLCSYAAAFLSYRYFEGPLIRLKDRWAATK